MASPILGAGIINAILFAAYGQAKQFIAVNSSSVIKPVDGSQPVLSIPQIALAGGIAGLINCVVAGPIELVKTQLQVQYTQEGAAFKFATITSISTTVLP
jgi:solute carrier family 25 carnitine/acylcarnitine transporter 20/29